MGELMRRYWLPAHGWKFDADGACVDMPNEPPRSRWAEKIQQSAYQALDRGDQCTPIPHGTYSSGEAYAVGTKLRAINDAHNDHLVWTGVDRLDNHKGSAGDRQLAKPMSHIPRGGTAILRVHRFGCTR